jgi:hypothetical protein
MIINQKQLKKQLQMPAWKPEDGQKNGSDHFHRSQLPKKIIEL